MLKKGNTKGKTYQEVRVGSGDWKWNDTGSYQWGTQERVSEFVLLIGPEFGVRSLELCYEVVTQSHSVEIHSHARLIQHLRSKCEDQHFKYNKRCSHITGSTGRSQRLRLE